MEQALHQSLINDIETLLASTGGIDEALAKTCRKSAEALIAAPDDHPLKDNLVNAVGQLRQQVHAQVEKRDAEYEKVEAQLTLASDALRQDKLKEAEDCTHKALSIAGQIHGLSAQRRAEIDKKLDTIYPRMRKLSAWRHWGTTQAREDLIDQIKQIPGSRMDPNKIVKTLREAKAQWQNWEKSGDHSEHKLWKTFSDACDTAYEPCREHFKVQKELRKKHLGEKRELIDGINSRYDEVDWAKPDWKEIDKWLRQSKGKFFKIGHTDYKHHKKLKANLDKAIEQFESHLSRERERSLKMRQKLLEDIAALDEVEDIRDAIAQLDQLKKKWVVTVLSKRGVENKLWDQYQKAQDTIYARRDEQRKEQDQVRNDNLKSKNQIVESLTCAAGVTPEELLAGQSVLAQHIDQFNEIGYVPRKAEKTLMNGWRNAQKIFKQALQRAQQAQATNAQHALIEKARFCAAIELKRVLGDAVDVETSRAGYDALPTISDKLESSMRQRLDTALGDTVPGKEQLDANTDAQLECCLKTEVILDLPSPDEFSRQRMAYQIERLSASMKKNKQAHESIDDLKLQLLTTGAIHPDQYEPVWARIETILNTSP